MLKRIINKIFFLIKHRDYFIRKNNVHRTAILEDKNSIILGKHAEIKEYVIIRSMNNKVSIGANSQINPFTVIYAGSNVSIGENVMIAPHCMIAGGNHNHKQVSEPMRNAISYSKGPIVIEDDVWIGANSTIVENVKIGKGAVIGAGSVVVNDVAPYDVVGGVPAKFIKNRLVEANKG